MKEFLLIVLMIASANSVCRIYEVVRYGFPDDRKKIAQMKEIYGDQYVDSRPKFSFVDMTTWQ